MARTLRKKTLRPVALLLWGGVFLMGLLPLFRGVLNFGNLTLLILSVTGATVTLFFGRIIALRRFLWGKLLLAIISFLLSVGVLLFAALSTQMAVAARKTPPPEKDLPLIVLGCQITGDRPAPILRNRLQAALTYLQAHPTASCIVTGGQGSDEAHTEASVMKGWLIAQGIAPHRIYTEVRATNTCENLTFSAELLAENRLGSQVVIATDSWHQLRGHLWAKRLGLTPYSASCPTSLFYLPTFHVRETLALARFFLLGH